MRASATAALGAGITATSETPSSSTVMVAPTGLLIHTNDTAASPTPPISIPVPPPDPAYPATICAKFSPAAINAGSTGRVKSLGTAPGFTA